MSHYDTLGVDPKATLQQIKDAYREKALRFHPDINPGKEQADAGKFQEVSNAYEVWPCHFCQDVHMHGIMHVTWPSCLS